MILGEDSGRARCSWMYPYCLQFATKWLAKVPLCDDHYDSVLLAARDVIVPRPPQVVPPKFEPWPSVVYYVTWPGRFESEVKIGVSTQLAQRLLSLRRAGVAPEVLVAERGDHKWERRRHREFGTLRKLHPVNGTLTEIFARAPILDEHVQKLRSASPDWFNRARL